MHDPYPPQPPRPWPAPAVGCCAPTLLSVLLWGGLRQHGRATLEASLTRLQDRAAMTRETVISGIRRLAELGLVAVTKRRVRIA